MQSPSLRVVGRAVLALMIGASAMLVATPANALPGSCNSYVASDGRGYARCTSGSGEYRVGIACKGWINLGYGFTSWGNWARPGGEYQSVAKCPIGSWNWDVQGNKVYYAYLERR